MEKHHLSIRQWAEEDKPREKLLLKGKAALSEAELIGILLGSGTRTMSAVDLAKSILSSRGHNLNDLARMSVKDLMQFKGIGEAKAIAIVAALELGRRRKAHDHIEKPKITSASDAYQLMKPELLDLNHEQFWIILMNRANQVIKKQVISMGGVSGTVADPKIIFKFALEQLASSLILVHNHPSGNLRPSDADIRLTRKLRRAGEMLDIPVLDHIIFGDQGYFSFADESMLP